MESDVTQPSAKELYELDFFEWTVRNAELLRSGRFKEADLGHIAEEIEDMGQRDQRELRSRLEVLLRHLLKWRLQPERRVRSWRLTTNTQRRRIRRLLGEMPSLRAHLEESVPAIRVRARQWGPCTGRVLPDRVEESEDSGTRRRRAWARRVHV